MDTFICGGAVRDTLLGNPVHDIDYMWVGTTPEHLISLGMKQVGADFPCFLDKDGNQHALARTETKNGVGYHGFICDFNPSITLEEDLSRRDITINSLAVKIEDWNRFVETKNESLVIDLFGGLADLKIGRLRHINEFFGCDPLRVLRVARFAARYLFSIAPETITLMTRLVDKGEMKTLTTERVWLEFEKAMMETSPARFITTLWRCSAWNSLFSEINSGSGLHALHKAVGDDLTFNERVAAFFADTNLNNVDLCLSRYKAPAELSRLIHNVSKARRTLDSMGMSYFRADPLDMLKTLDAFRRPEGLKQTCNVLRCLGQSFTTILANELEIAHSSVAEITFASLSLEEQKLTGAAVGNAIDAHRNHALARLTFTA